MAYEEFVSSKKGQEACVSIPYFCGECIEAFKFLILEHNFEKAIIRLIGREYKIEFRKKNLRIYISYEMGNLPMISIFNNGKEINLKEIDPKFSENYYLQKFKLHTQIRSMLNVNYSSVDNYINAVSDFWNLNKQGIMDEVKMYVDFIGNTVKENFAKILNPR